MCIRDSRWGSFCYVKVMGLTQQGTPHLHLAYAVPARRPSPSRLNAWLCTTWQRLVNLDIRPPTHAGFDPKDDMEAALGYIMQYQHKDQFYQSREYQQARNELLNVKEDLDWNYKIQKKSRSQNWPRALQLNLESAIQAETGEIINKHHYRKAYARYKYYLEKDSGVPQDTKSIEAIAYYQFLISEGHNRSRVSVSIFRHNDRLIYCPEPLRPRTFGFQTQDGTLHATRVQYQNHKSLCPS